MCRLRWPVGAFDNEPFPCAVPPLEELRVEGAECVVQLMAVPLTDRDGGEKPVGLHHLLVGLLDLVGVVERGSKDAGADRGAERKGSGDARGHQADGRLLGETINEHAPTACALGGRLVEGGGEAQPGQQRGVHGQAVRHLVHLNEDR